MPHTPPRTRASTDTFSKQWHETSVANFLDPSSLPIPKVQKAWERTAQSPFKKGQGRQKVWRRPGGAEPKIGPKVDAGTVRVVKKQCLEDRESFQAKEEIDEFENRRKGSVAVATRTERKGASPRKRRIARRRTSTMPKPLDLDQHSLPPPEQYTRPTSPVARTLEADDDDEPCPDLVPVSPEQVHPSASATLLDDADYRSESNQDEAPGSGPEAAAAFPPEDATHETSFADSLVDDQGEYASDQSSNSIVETEGDELLEQEEWADEDEPVEGLSTIYEDETEGNTSLISDGPMSTLDTEQSPGWDSAATRTAVTASETDVVGTGTSMSDDLIGHAGEGQEAEQSSLGLSLLDRNDNSLLEEPIPDPDTGSVVVQDDDVSVKSGEVALRELGQLDADMEPPCEPGSAVGIAPTDSTSPLDEDSLEDDMPAPIETNVESNTGDQPVEDIVAETHGVLNQPEAEHDAIMSEPNSIQEEAVDDSPMDDPLERTPDIETVDATDSTVKVDEDILSNCDAASLSSQPSQVGSATEDAASIADGLTLDLDIKFQSAPNKSPTKIDSTVILRLDQLPEDITTDLDADTAILKDFLSRAAASKANRSTIIHKRESLSNRRDSDAIKQALASPRKVLEDKDPNSPSPRKKSTKDGPSSPSAKNILAQEIDDIEDDTMKLDDVTISTSTRRSTRARSSRIPPPSALPTPNRISIRTPSQEPVVAAKKTEAQELALLTRNNTRRNKGAALNAFARLKKIETDTALDSPYRSSEDDTIRNLPGRHIRWDEQLVYFQDFEGKSVQLATALPVPTLLAAEKDVEAAEQASTATTSDSKKRKAKDPSAASTPKVRRIRGLGASNGTPAKGLLATASSLLPDVVVEEVAQAKATAAKEPQILAIATKSKRTVKMKTEVGVTSPRLQAHVSTVPAIAPVKTAEPSKPKQTKSRLAAPKKVVLPGAITASKTASEEKTASATPARRRARRV